MDGESEDGWYIKNHGGNNMTDNDIKMVVNKYLLPKAQKERDRLLLCKIQEASIYNNGTMIRCKVDNNWLSGKKIKDKDKHYEDKFDLAFKYFKNEIFEIHKESLKECAQGRSR